MKALVIGFGSIGERHVNVLKELGLDVAIVCRRPIDVSPRYDSITNAIEHFSPDYVIIASSTNEHRNDIDEVSRTDFRGKLLIEKPLYDTGEASLPSGFSRAKVAYNLRFHPALQFFRQQLQSRNVHAVIAYTGSYLPDWRPGSDYRLGYSADPQRGGGVLRDLSHELDYLLWLFGDWQSLAAHGGQFSQLEVSSDDVFSVFFETANVQSISLNMNYLDTTTRREMIALTDQGSIRLDLTAGTVETPEIQKSFETARNDTYRWQHQAILSDDESIICDVSEGLRVMRMIGAIEQASRTKSWITA